eukprot:1139049-Pelagomonas_calceolata.AAC.3
MLPIMPIMLVWHNPWPGAEVAVQVGHPLDALMLNTILALMAWCSGGSVGDRLGTHWMRSCSTLVWHSWPGAVVAVWVRNWALTGCAHAQNP